MSITRKDFDTVTPQVGDFVGGIRPGATPREDVKYPIGELPYVQLTPGRIAMQELTSGNLSTSGWYKIAKVESLGFQPAIADFHIIPIGLNRNASKSCHVEFYEGGDFTRNSQNIELKGDSSIPSLNGVSSLRIAGSGATNNSGGYLEAYLDIDTTLTITVQMFGNISNLKGFELLEDVDGNLAPVLSDGLLPDGVTPATFIEAGAELILNKTSTRYPLPVIPTFLSNDTLGLTFIWSETPKQGSSLNIDYASGNIRLVANGTAITLDNTFTEGNLNINGKFVSIILTKVGAFTGLANYGMVINGFGPDIKAVIS